MDKYTWTRFTQPQTCSVAVLMYLCSQSTWIRTVASCKLRCRAGQSYFSACSNISSLTALLCVGDVFLDPRRLCEYGPERLSNEHTQSLNGFFFVFLFKKRGKEKPQSIYITEEECLSLVFCSASVSFISHSLTVTGFHSSQQSTMMSSLNSDRAAMPRGYH